jgi:hypothetical protein
MMESTIPVIILGLMVVVIALTEVEYEKRLGRKNKR